MPREQKLVARVIAYVKKKKKPIFNIVATNETVSLSPFFVAKNALDLHKKLLWLQEMGTSLIPPCCALQPLLPFYIIYCAINVKYPPCLLTTCSMFFLTRVLSFRHQLVLSNLSSDISQREIEILFFCCCLRYIPKVL